MDTPTDVWMAAVEVAPDLLPPQRDEQLAQVVNAVYRATLRYIEEQQDGAVAGRAVWEGGAAGHG